MRIHAHLRVRGFEREKSRPRSPATEKDRSVAVGIRGRCVAHEQASHVSWDWLEELALSPDDAWID